MKPEQESTGRDPRAEELDRFWDIDSLLPPKRPVPKSLHTDTVEIRLEEKADPSGEKTAYGIPIPVPVNFGKSYEVSIPRPAEKTSAEPVAGQTVIHSVAASDEEPVIHRYVDPLAAQKIANAPKPEEEYIPPSALIHKVRIFRWKSNYQYYESFACTAEKLQSVHGSPCKHVPFFSYAPQYSQMNRSQMNWYLRFRDCVKNGEYPDTDYSYVLLLIYEVINLAGKPDASQGQKLLCDLWKHYRARFRQLDSNLPEWICDYSLLHHLPPPAGLDSEQLAQIMNRCGLKEFYVGGNPDEGYLRALLTFCTNYDYHKSKFYTPEHAALFDRTVPEVLHQVTEYLSESGKLFATSGMEDCRMTRDAFSTALCSCRVKRKIEVSYCSFSRSHELRFLITDVIKYTENKLRAYLSIRSRLSIYALPTAIRQKIDEWFDANIIVHVPEKKRPEPERAAYESLYDLQDQTLSFANAAEIELESWNTTQKLVEAFGESDSMQEFSVHEDNKTEESVVSASSEQADISVPPVSGNTQETGTEKTLGAQLHQFSAFLNAALAQDPVAQEREAKAMGSLPDALAEHINEIVADTMGDILLEDLGGFYGVIEDYRNLSDEWA